MTSNGKVGIVTGAGTGVGKASALALLHDGYSVVQAGRRTEPLEETMQEAGDAGSRTLTVSADVGDPKAVATLFSKTIDAFGRLDVLFNNAGHGAPGILLEDLTYEQWKRVVDSNLTGTFLCTQEAIKIMKNQDPMGGRIINNGSTASHVPRPNSAPYVATKHGITGLTKATSLDGRKYNIACSQIDIGNAATTATDRMSSIGALQAHGEVRIEPRFDVDNVAEAVVFMSNLPLDANVQFIQLIATKMPFIGRG
ncbi:MAG: 3-oxoacyl-ACP reductase [Chloroflexi bacterium]|jgi:NAD(P)-dependent dehydrogenase (short-subunit alcohol dehydrogenase family)|nr:3-oxoacyl-ACP reductase [Chloroflexota bacterium]MDP6422806.1 SDR family oxidoreductase [SAR202 cluster bacterium]MDP6665303.1 SDR family oxidoreductase [SAR202 cluster bacterium]MQG56564.1 SDR family oxidoreductase [SAR202 cluster bacterium]HAL47818.1 3-oxoacyl-ACP reductase [Dehalococcoidia bacterium]|tara:strand:- start:6941 stop:7702 length:762 start_codon:yes stop_codon:yes gene_type:complete